MPVDPMDTEGFEDAYEDEPEEEAVDGFEIPADDAAEQNTELLRQREAPITGRASVDLDEMNPADAAEQARVVEENEDEYR